ncbi:hypothetical protein [Mangrovimonas futianensis]|uniref:hypothetical protein n=1 Tax=Mangrovimonas futianensis TaxID=2895523 RepID=UPI001E3EF9F2|nr:hypothetical protein [Mangrovimonas futianensis]MCF1420772.1 hypothetical protein [Mangrovimonas futianensis]
MKKVISSVLLTLFMFGHINAKVMIKEKSCEDQAFDAAGANYEIFQDSFLAGMVFNAVYNDCMGIEEIGE